MAVTIKDVAKYANVSPSTVSRVIQDSPVITDETKKRVRQAMKDLDYHLNLSARRLVNQKTKVIGLVLPGTNDIFYYNPFFSMVIKGINEQVDKSGYSLLLLGGESEEERLNKLKESIYGHSIDGLVFLYVQQVDPLLEFVQEVKFPYVLIGTPQDKGINYVDNDNVQSSYDATNLLIKKGARKIGFLGGLSALHVTRDRLKGYKKSLKENNIAIIRELIHLDCRFIQEDGYQIAKKSLPNQYDALVIADELISDGFQQGWSELFVKDIPIITFRASDPRKQLNYQKNPFINIHAQELGKKSIDLLVSHLAENSLETNHLLVKASLVDI